MELPKQLVEFVRLHLELSSTLKSAKQEMGSGGEGCAGSIAEVHGDKSPRVYDRVCPSEREPLHNEHGTGVGAEVDSCIR